VLVLGRMEGRGIGSGVPVDAPRESRHYHCCGGAGTKVGGNETTAADERLVAFTKARQTIAYARAKQA
jgi:Fe-S oxidoreductase